MDYQTKRNTPILRFYFGGGKHCLLCNSQVEHQKQIDFDACQGYKYETIVDRQHEEFSTPRATWRFMNHEYFVCAECMIKGWRARAKKEVLLQIEELSEDAIDKISERIRFIGDELLKKLEELEKERDEVLECLTKLGL